MNTGTHEVDCLKAKAAEHHISLWSQYEHYIAYAKATNAAIRSMDFDAFVDFTQAVDNTYIGEADSYVELQTKMRGRSAPAEDALIQCDGLWFERQTA
jgi:hypothetical protein